MDYGQPINTPDDGVSFTPEGDSIPENSLNTDSYTPERNPGDVGNTVNAVFSSEQNTGVTQEIAQPVAEIQANSIEGVTDPSGQSYDQSIQIAPGMPPGYEEPQNDPQVTSAQLYDASVAKIEKGKLGRNVIREIEKVNRKLSQDDDAASYNDAIRGSEDSPDDNPGLAKITLTNSFGEKAKWKDAA